MIPDNNIFIFKAGDTHYLLNLLTKKIINKTRHYDAICYWPGKKLIFFSNSF